MSSARNSHSRRKRRNRGRFSFLFKMLSILAVLAALTLGATVFFQLEEVVVSGNSRYTAQEIEAASGLQMGDNLFRINKNQIEKDIQQKLPYVDTVDIKRGLPSTIVITVKEWDAVARVEPTPLSQTTAPEGDSGGGQSGQDTDSSGAQDQTADQTWLISVKAKLLEPAGADSSAILVSGLSALSPRAGTYLAVPQEQQDKLDALLQLLAALEEQNCMDTVSQIDLTGSTQIRMFYRDRFWVKLPMSCDFSYKLRALETVAPDWEGYDKGTFDLTQEDYTVVFSPG